MIEAIYTYFFSKCQRKELATMKNKKLICGVLLGVMSICTLGGCGKDTSTTSTNDNTWTIQSEINAWAKRVEESLDAEEARLYEVEQARMKKDGFHAGADITMLRKNEIIAGDIKGAVDDCWEKGIVKYYGEGNYQKNDFLRFERYQSLLTDWYIKLELSEAVSYEDIMNLYSADSKVTGYRLGSHGLGYFIFEDGKAFLYKSGDDTDSFENAIWYEVLNPSDPLEEMDYKQLKIEDGNFSDEDLKEAKLIEAEAQETTAPSNDEEKAEANKQDYEREAVRINNYKSRLAAKGEAKNGVLDVFGYTLVYEEDVYLAKTESKAGEIKEIILSDKLNYESTGGALFNDELEYYGGKQTDARFEFCSYSTGVKYWLNSLELGEKKEDEVLLENYEEDELVTKYMIGYKRAYDNDSLYGADFIYMSMKDGKAYVGALPLVKSSYEEPRKNYVWYEVLNPSDPLEEIGYEIFEYKYDVNLGNDEGGVLNAKPVIYLYPEEEMQVDVTMEIDGEFTYTYPKYDNGWSVIASPDGTLTDIKTGDEYSYLFWESTTDVEYDMSEGFVVKGEDATEFLKEKLSFMGLTPREYNEFIVYWAPILEQNEYNLVKFAGEEYVNSAKLNISPAPDSVLRVFMVYEAIDEPVKVKEQEIKPFVREGFTVVEWGGRGIVKNS